jgi:hypothetical protein
MAEDISCTFSLDRWDVDDSGKWAVVLSSGRSMDKSPLVMM